MSDSFWLIRQHRQEEYERTLAAAVVLGVDRDDYDTGAAFEHAVMEAGLRSGPCRTCGARGGRGHVTECDSCEEAREAVRVRERAARKVALERRRAASRLIANMPAGRRRMLQHSGLEFDSPEAAFDEAYDER